MAFAAKKACTIALAMIATTQCAGALLLERNGTVVVIGSEEDKTERSSRYTANAIAGHFDAVTAEIAWIRPESDEPGAICDATDADLVAAAGKLVVFHSQSRTKNCDVGALMPRMEAVGVVGAIELVPSPSRFNWASDTTLCGVTGVARASGRQRSF